MRGTDIDDVCVTPDTMVQVVKIDRNVCFTFREQRLQLSHSHRIVLGIVECKVADLKKVKGHTRMIYGRLTFRVTSARSRRYTIVLAILRPECFFLRW